MCAPKTIMIIIWRMTLRTPTCSVKPTAVLASLALAIPVAAVGAIGIGQLHASPAQVLSALAAGPGLIPQDDPTVWTVVWQLRLPRVLTGLCVGAVLASAGTCLQAVVRNDLADPYLLGISSGASFGAALAIAAGAGQVVGALTATGGAFIGALGALAMVVVMVGGRRLSGSRLVLAGLTTGYFLSAATSLVVVLSDNRDTARVVTFWMLGSLGRASWQEVPVLVITALAALGYLVLRARSLDAVGLGDDVARSLGIDPFRLRRSTTTVCALAVAAAVSASGSVGFVGLVVPHMARRLVGATHRALLPASALLGALVLIIADTLARTVLAPREIPLGILTALVGTPMLMSMLWRRRSQLE